jgi:hypothetical protein
MARWRYRNQLFSHINLHDGFGRSMIAVVVCILGNFREVTATRYNAYIFLLAVLCGIIALQYK